ncbi:hypothetical protein PoB_005525700 [Plakobranchus ocellatus]|uniref:Uncharacterized protein n=1 Tax=Plakobranchus ocellatus TaxID=259542 RepID=A0AAV4CB45_9GAST|nr:hypothetical protein PoB_005525700 [Plakobranchus ocellatus]
MRGFPGEFCACGRFSKPKMNATSLQVLGTKLLKRVNSFIGFSSPKIHNTSKTFTVELFCVCVCACAYVLSTARLSLAFGRLLGQGVASGLELAENSRLRSQGDSQAILPPGTPPDREY